MFNRKLQISQIFNRNQFRGLEIKVAEGTHFKSTSAKRKNVIHFAPINELLPEIKQCQFHKGK